jgi:hypothetical protein
MKESEAWVLLAQVMENDNQRYSEFLCLNLKYAGRLQKIPDDLRHQMIDWLEWLCAETEGVAYNETPEDMGEENEGRITACLLFAEMARDNETS